MCRSLVFRKWLINVQILSELLVYYFNITQEVVLLQYHFVQAIPPASQANPEVIFNRQWLAEKISDNIDNLIEVGLRERGIVTDNHSANVNGFIPLKNIQFRIKLYKAPAKL